MSNVFIELENEIEQRGIQKGVEKRNLEIAKKLISKNMSIPDIIDCTGLDEGTIMNLAM